MVDAPNKFAFMVHALQYIVIMTITIVVRTVIVKLGLVWQSAGGVDRFLSTNAPTKGSRGHAPQEFFEKYCICEQSERIHTR